MNGRHGFMIVRLGAAFLGSLLIVLVYPRLKKIEKRGPAPERVVGILPVGVHAGAASISAIFNKAMRLDP